MHIYIAPKIVGDKKALGSINGLNIGSINKTIKLDSLNIIQLGKDILVEAYVLRNS